MKFSGEALTKALGFACLFLSSFRSNQILAGTMIGVIALALAADLLLLPALLQIFPFLERPKILKGAKNK